MEDCLIKRVNNTMSLLLWEQLLHYRLHVTTPLSHKTASDTCESNECHSELRKRPRSWFHVCVCVSFYDFYSTAFGDIKLLFLSRRRHRECFHLLYTARVSPTLKRSRNFDSQCSALHTCRIDSGDYLRSEANNRKILVSDHGAPFAREKSNLSDLWLPGNGVVTTSASSKQKLSEFYLSDRDTATVGHTNRILHKKELAKSRKSSLHAVRCSWLIETMIDKLSLMMKYEQTTSRQSTVIAQTVPFQKDFFSCFCIFQFPAETTSSSFHE